ncbi:signal peptidase I [Streptomyces sp. NPDC051909]|uniref:signal peptidase I n=1 Tax=Streptomyces sp. NPDC051909 TaxID=3154944 RepID=UPI0034273B73
MSVTSRTSRTKDGRGRLGSVLSGLAVAVGFVLFLGGFVAGAVLYQPYTVPSDSMTPTLEVGSKVLAERVDGADVKRGDIVVFQAPLWGDVPMVKRVVGVGGDTIACCGAGGRLTLDGEPVDETYLRAGKVPSAEKFTVTVPEGSLFLLGDERHNSLDSRSHLQDASHGFVPRSAVLGRIDAVAWPAPGVVERPAGFAALSGGISSPGPVVPLFTAIGAGCVLILAGAAYGPVARRLGGGRKPAPPKAKAGERDTVSA